MAKKSRARARRRKRSRAAPARVEPAAPSPRTPEGSGSSLERRYAVLVLALLLLAAGAQYSWNAFTIGGLVGYDAKYHVEYILTLVHEGRLPRPLEGWSTFHPPLYYLLSSVV